MIRALYPGSFDPITFGHLDVIERSSKITEELIVGVLENPSKSSLFTKEERVEMIKEVTSHIKNIKIESFEGLLVDFAHKKQANIVIRGLRAVTDFEYELQISQTNRIINGGVDTVFLTTSLEYAYLSSSTVKEVAMFGGDISKFVPEPVVERVYSKLRS